PMHDHTSTLEDPWLFPPVSDAVPSLAHPLRRSAARVIVTKVHRGSCMRKFWRARVLDDQRGFIGAGSVSAREGTRDGIAASDPEVRREDDALTVQPLLAEQRDVESSAPTSRAWIPLGQMLVDDGILTPEQLAIGLARQRECKERIGQILIQMNVLDEDVLIRYLARQFRKDAVAAQEL